MLNGKLIVLTRDLEGNRIWAKHLRHLGARVYELPTIQISPLPSTDTTLKLFHSLSGFDWIIFTSAKTAQFLRTMTIETGGHWPPKGPLIAVIGERTAHAARKAGLTVSFQPSLATSQSLGKEVAPVQGRNLLLPSTNIATNELASLFESRGANVSSLPIYQTSIVSEPDSTLSSQIQSDKVDGIVFASPSAVRGFCRRVDAHSLRLACSIPVVAIGPSVAETLEDAGFLEIHQSNKSSIEGVVEALQRLIQSKAKGSV